MHIHVETPGEERPIGCDFKHLGSNPGYIIDSIYNLKHFSVPHQRREVKSENTRLPHNCEDQRQQHLERFFYKKRQVMYQDKGKKQAINLTLSLPS